MKYSFKENPNLYIYYIKRGKHRIRKIPKAPWDAVSSDILRKKDDAIVSQQIFLPRPYTEDKNIRDAVVVHQLSRLLASQKGISKTKGEKVAVKLQNKYLKNKGLTPSSFCERLLSLYHDKKKWKL